MLRLQSRTPKSASRGLLTIVVNIGLLSIASGCWADFRSLESVAESTPDQEVVVRVSFHRIQRSPAIVALLSDTGLSLEHVKFKNVGSGGGESGVGDPFGRTQPVVDSPKEVEAALARIEAFRANHYESLARVQGTFRETDCPYDDFTSPVKDTHGIPGEYSVELSCGLRIVAIRVRGPAGKAFSFAQINKDIAEFAKMPSNDEILQWRLEMIESQNTETPAD